MMKYVYFLMALGFATAGHAAAPACEAAGDKVSLAYVETVTRRAETEGGAPRTETRHIRLTRNRLQAAIEYADTGMTELWEQPVEGRLRLVKYFNAEKRGIEYQPGEVAAATADSDWSARRRLVSDRLIESMTPVERTGDGCDRQVTYRSDEGERSVELVRLPGPDIVERYVVNRPGLTVRLVLESRRGGAYVNEYFDTLAGYPTTDYADIGDNESDPFLMKMINQGFIEHGASGFYDAQGNDIGGHRH